MIEQDLTPPDELLVDEETLTAEAPLPSPTALPNTLLLDIADRRGFAFLGAAPATRRQLDEPLVLETTGVVDRDRDKADLRSLFAAELVLTTWVLVHHGPAWAAFTASYPRNLDHQPPEPAAARRVAETCRSALARQAVPDLGTMAAVPRPVRARLHRWCRTNLHDEVLASVSDEISAAREAILVRNGRLASYFARRMYHHGLTWRERLSFGVAGLCRALDSFEFGGGASFSTYARHWILARVTRAANETGGPMRCVGAFAELRMKVARHVREQIWFDDPDCPAHPSVTTATPERRALVDAGLVLETTEAHRLAALTAEPWSPTRDERWASNWAALDAGLTQLGPRPRSILERRWGLDARRTRHTLSEVGVHEGLSRERIRQLERAAIASLRTHLEPDLDGSIDPTSSGSPSSSS